MKGTLKFATTAGILLALVSVGLTSCGKNDDEPEAGATTVTFYANSFETWSNEHLQNLAKEFNKDKTDGIQLDLKIFSDAYDDALTSARENGAAPDIFMISYNNLYNNAIKPGYAAPLDELMGADNISDILDNVKSTISYKNQVYAWPLMLEPSSMFYYRKSYFQKAGITEAPTTWAQLWEDCAKLKPTLDKGQYCLGIQTGVALGWATWGMQQNTCGHLAVNDKWDKCLVDEQGYRDLDGFFYDAYANGYVPTGDISGSGYNALIAPLCEDKLAMTFTGSWGIGTIKNDYPDLVSDVGCAMIPTLSGDASKCSATNGGWNVCISKSSTHQDLAAKVIKALYADTATASQYFDLAGYCKAAPTKSLQAYLAQHSDTTYKDYLSAVSAVSKNAIFEPHYSWDISVAVETMFETMGIKADSSKDTAYKNSTIESAMSTCLDSINKIMTSSTYVTNPDYE